MVNVNNVFFEINVSEVILYLKYKKWFTKLMTSAGQLNNIEFAINCILDFKPTNYWFGNGFEVYVYQKRYLKDHKHIQYLQLKIPPILSKHTACRLEWLFKAARNHSELGKKVTHITKGQKNIKFYSVYINDGPEQKIKKINA